MSDGRSPWSLPGRVLRRVRRLATGRSSAPARSRDARRRTVRASVSAEDERSVVERLLAGIEGHPVTTGPLVSMVMLNRDGEALLRQCLPAIARTAYSNVELVVVDNGSSDASLATLDAMALPFPVQVIRNEGNASFSDANNQAVAACSGELVLLINNDIEPIDPRWLGFMVETMQRSHEVAAVGARLVYPAMPLGGGTWRHAPLSLQHGGVQFRLTDGIPIPVPAGAGEDAASAWAAATRDAPALTAACLLLRRADLDAVGRLTSGYDYGLEDVDLCLKLRALGRRLVYEGRAALWHHESATRGADPRDERRARIARNRELYAARWAPSVRRAVMLAALHGESDWRAEPITVAVRSADGVQSPSPGLRAAIADLGWRLDAGAGPDVVLALGAVLNPDLDDGHAIVVPATVLPDAGTAPPPAIAGALLDAADRSVRTPHVAVIDSEAWDGATIARSLRTQGVQAQVRTVNAWRSLEGSRHDAVLFAGGIPREPVRAGQLALSWRDAVAGEPSAALAPVAQRIRAWVEAEDLTRVKVVAG